MVKSNNANAFKLQHAMMLSSGVWPEESSTITYKIKCIISWILSLGLFITMTMQVIHDITDFTKLSEILYIMVTIAATVGKMASFTYQRKKFLKMIKFLKEPIFMSYTDDLDHYMAATIKSSTFIANFYRYLVGCCIVMFIVYPIVDNKPLPFPFSFELGSFKYCMYVFQIASIGCCAWNNSCIDTLTTSLMGIGAAQLSILYEKIVNIKHMTNCLEDKNNVSVKNKDITPSLEQCVEHHNAIIILIDYIEEVFTVGLLAQFVTSVMVICNTVFHIVLMSTINSQFVMLLNYFLVIMCQLFMYCWYGNELIVKSVQIGDACYQFNWYKENTFVKSYLFIIMERSKRPLTITTLKISTLSLNAFKSLLQWSYSGLALLIKMYQKQRGKYSNKENE